MKVLQVIPTLSAGGAETLAAELSLALAKRGHQVGVALLGGARGARGVALADALHEAGLPLWGRVEGSPRRPRAALELVRTLQSFRPDIVHTHLYAADVATALLGMLGGKRRLVRTLHNTSIQGTRSATGTRILDRMFHMSVACGTRVAQAYDEYFQGRHRSRLEVVPNGISLPVNGMPRDADALRQAVRDALGIAADAFLFVHVGAFRGRSLATSQKAQDILLKAMAVLAADPAATRAHLLLIGDGELIEEARVLAGSLGIGNRTTFAGAVADVSRYLSASDAFAFPSRYEGLPIALIEACVAGLPAVTTALPEIVEVMGARPHASAQVDDALAFAACMAECLRDPETARTEALANAARVAGNYAIETCAMRYEALYTQLLPDPRRSRNA